MDKAMRRHETRPIPFLAGLFTASALLLIMLLNTDLGEPEVFTGHVPAGLSNAPEIDIQKDGPLVDAKQISLAEARAASERSIPVPPTNPSTEERTAIWLDDGGQVAFVWTSGLRYYINRVDSDWSKQEAVEAWQGKVQGGQEASEAASMTTVRGEPAIAYEPTEKNPSSLTFIENGFSLQFVSPGHSVEELRDLANAIRYEE
jgi:hypothetical protein